MKRNEYFQCDVVHGLHDTHFAAFFHPSTRRKCNMYLPKAVLRSTQKLTIEAITHDILLH